MTGTEVSTELAGISAVQRTDPGRYWSDPNIQARRAELLGARLEGAPAPLPDDVAAGIAEIKQIIRTAPATYYDGPRARELQERYAALLQARDAARAGVGAALSSETPDADAAVDRVLASVSDPEGFAASFDTLPVAAGDVILREMSRPAPNVEPADDATIYAFMAFPEGMDLAAKWGKATARNVARFNARVERVFNRLPVAERGAVTDWVDTLSSDEATAIAEALVA